MFSCRWGAPVHIAAFRRVFGLGPGTWRDQVAVAEPDFGRARQHVLAPRDQHHRASSCSPQRLWKDTTSSVLGHRPYTDTAWLWQGAPARAPPARPAPPRIPLQSAMPVQGHHLIVQFIRTLPRAQFTMSEPRVQQYVLVPRDQHHCASPRCAQRLSGMGVGGLNLETFFCFFITPKRRVE